MNTFAIWLTTRVVDAPACACADLGVLGSGEKNGEGNFGTGTYAVLVHEPEPRPRHLRESVHAHPSSRKEYPLTSLRTRVVRVARWMTASASWVRVEDRVERVSIDWCSPSARCALGGFWMGLGGAKSARRRGIDRASVDDVGESTRLVMALAA